ncbi:MAG: hypothetical protein GC172_02125 [Phycisphaera sp.]|nr:hypothetical protein [Phycisphaera sp.]
MFRTSAVCVAVTTAVVFASSASASVTVFNNQALYNLATAGFVRAVEDFNDYSGSYTSPLIGTAGDITWSASSVDGFEAVNGGLSTALPGSMTIQFTGPAVFGVFGNFFGTDVSDNIVSGLVLVTLADGTGSLILVDDPNEFFGFVSTGQAISSIAVTANELAAGLPVLRASVDNLGFDYVPAPGAIALLGLAGLVGRRRR